jgi:biotin carboxyl carrier protein
MAEGEIKKTKYSKLNIDEVKYDTLLTDKYKNRQTYSPANPKLIKAFIPGTIVKISVRKGRNVEEGEDLLVLEAMKMQNQVKSPIAGKIKKVNVKKGQMVPKNFVMIEFE